MLGLFAASGLVLAVVSASRASEQVAPPWLDERLDALPDGTTVLDDWTTGSYLLARHPGLQLVMHGYGDVFTDAEIERNADLARLRPGWDLDVEELAPDVAVLDPDSSLGYAVEHQLGWTRLEGDDDFVVLAPPQE